MHISYYPIYPRQSHTHTLSLSLSLSLAFLLLRAMVRRLYCISTKLNVAFRMYTAVVFGKLILAVMVLLKHESM